MIEADLCDGTKAVSFLGITFGLIADVDIGSEALRCLGFMRAYLLVAYRIMLPKVYVARISYLPLKRDPTTGKPIGVKSTDPKLTLPKLNEPVPEDWVTEEGRYYMVYAMNLSMLDPITLLAPESTLDDGVMWLVFCREGMSRLEMIQWFASTKEAGHIGKTGIELIPIRAFRFEPIRPTGYMSLDAESVPFGPVQGQILGQKTSVLSS